MSWRYIAQRATTGEWLHWDLPLRRDELSWALSGPSSLRGFLSPEVGSLVAPDGRPLLDEWGTLLYAEADGIIRAGVIVVRSRFDGATWAVEGRGFASYPHGIPYTGDWGGTSVDPLDAVREVWRHVQAHPDGDLGVVVDATTSPIRMGRSPVPSYKEVFIGGKWVRKDSVDPALIVPDAKSTLAKRIMCDDGDLELSTLGRFAELTPPYPIKVVDETMTVTARRGLHLDVTRTGNCTATSTEGDYRAGTNVRHIGTPERTIPADPGERYGLSWWEAPDCGAEVDQLAQTTPFDYAETHAWKVQSNGLATPEVDHRIVLGYPRLGTRRFDLAFEQGVNVTRVVTPERDGDDFANEALGLGAGEGKKTLRSSVAERDGRLRRAVLVSNKGVRRSSALSALTRRELAARRNVLEISEVEVQDHPDAPIGSWALGDDVLIKATVPWLGDVAVWSRVVGWTLVSDTRARLSLVRSDSFTYGRPDA